MDAVPVVTGTESGRNGIFNYFIGSIVLLGLVLEHYLRLLDSDV